jgi:tRNA(Ile)-lysidine synthase
LWPDGEAERPYLARFETVLRRLISSDNPRLLLAISGGPDSLALLLLAKQIMPDRITAATVDHRLRPESAIEAAYVASICADLSVPHHILQPATPITGNLQSSARAARYALLEQTADENDCDLIATAHHGDDQLETLLMRLARGSGVDGMSGIRPRNGRIVRPLLGFSKYELEEICKLAEIAPVRDPSNDNTEFDRVAMRKWLLQVPHPFRIDRIGRTAGALQDAGIALEWMTCQLVASRVQKNVNEIQCDATELPYELQRRLLLASLAQVDPDLTPRGPALVQLLSDLNEGKTTTIGNILCMGGPIWQFSPAPPRRNDT